MKIISLVTSASEILYDLDLNKQLFGFSYQCNNKPNLRNLPSVTSSKNKYWHLSLEKYYDSNIV